MVSTRLDNKLAVCMVSPLFPDEKLISVALVTGIKTKERGRQYRDWSSYGC